MPGWSTCRGPGAAPKITRALSISAFVIRLTDAADNFHRDLENTMKFICLGYLDEKKWAAMSNSERDGMLAECSAYDEVLRKNGHFVGGEALQSARVASTLRYQNGKVMVTDGPYAETKEQLGGILVLEAQDMKHAVELMSKHPGVRLGGPFEIRPAAERCSSRAAAKAV
jgi:hypothetical protein